MLSAAHSQAEISLEERTEQLRLVIDIISDKWRIAVIHQLSGGPLRTSRLQRALDRIAPKVLTQTLRGLERDGLVRREVHAVTPPRVEYRLTDAARRLLTALDSLCRWSQLYGGETLQARSVYDAGELRAQSIVSTTRNRALPDIIRS